MPLFLITCVCDEGVYESSFRVVEAPSRLAIAENMVRDPYRWKVFLERSHFWEQVRDRWWSPEEFLKKLSGSHVDGDSQFQLAIHEVTKVEPCGSTIERGLTEMAYREFTLDQVRRAFSLELKDHVDLFGAVPEVAVGRWLRSILDESVPLAIDLPTEKARSELIVAPVLLETRRRTGRRIGLFSGIDFDVAPEQGLKGVSDFILTRSPAQLVLSAPAVAIVQARHENIKGGLGQCAAEMVAARLFNKRRGEGPAIIHGAVTTGTAWRFLKLEGDTLFVDKPEYPLEPVGRILAILLHCVGYDAAQAETAT
jgi:hypothetical protein